MSKSTSPPPALAAEHLNRRCRPEEFPFRTTAEISEADGVLIQERALAALGLAVRIRSWSHNVYVMGTPGSGRHDAVRYELEREAAGRARPSDWRYVNRFYDPQRPRALPMPAGRAAVPAALKSESYRNRRAQLDRDVAAGAVRHLIEETRSKYSDCPGILDHLAKVEEDLVENAGSLFRGEPATASVIAGLERADERLGQFARARQQFARAASGSREDRDKKEV